jgi:hypothetical protein
VGWGAVRIGELGTPYLLPAVVSALVTYLLPIPSVGVYASIVGAVVLAGLAVMLLKCYLYLRTLSPKEENP